MHNAAFAELGLDYLYVPFHVPPEELGKATKAIRALGLRGVNVTVPHKEKIIRHLDSVSELAGSIGAVNTVVNHDGRLHGDNTDLAGFVLSLRARKLRLRGRRAVVIGAGGASRAVLCGLAELGVAEVLLANRTRSRSARLYRQLATHTPPTRMITLQDLALPTTFDGVRLVVNATSLGWGDRTFPELAIQASDPRCLFYDMVYGMQTAFLEQAERARRPSMDGGEMLVLQAAKSFTLWTKRRAPTAAMRIAFNNKY